MIIGTGIDIVELERIKVSIEKFGNNFLNRIYTAKEQLEAEKKSDKIAYFSGRWAAKEAISKALGSGFGEYCSWIEIEVLNDEKKKPIATLSGTTRRTFDQLHGKDLHISISHSKNSAVAIAIIEKNRES